MDRQYPGTPHRPVVAAIQHWRRRLSGTGVLMIVLGILAIIMPVVSSYAVDFLIGAVLTFGGLLAVLMALSFQGTRVFVWMLVAGMFPLCAGLYLLFFPSAGLVTLTFLIAAILLLTGLSQSAFAFDMRGIQGAGWVLVSGLISVGLAALIFAVLPEASTVLLGILLGIDLLSSGIALVLLAAVMPR